MANDLLGVDIKSMGSDEKSFLEHIMTEEQEDAIMIKESKDPDMGIRIVGPVEDVKNLYEQAMWSLGNYEKVVDSLEDVFDKYGFG